MQEYRSYDSLVPNLGRKVTFKKEEAAEDEGPAEAAQEEEKKKKSVVLSNPKWEADKVGFNEETPISVDIQLPEEHAHKKKVTFELFAKTPKGPERISQGEAMADDASKAICKIPVYIPNYTDEDGNRLEKVEYYFLAKHSEAEPLDGQDSPKLVDEMADRLIESHILPDITFKTNSSYIHPKHAEEIKGMCLNIKDWKKKTPDGKLAVFGHADAVGAEAENKKLSERRGRALVALLCKDADGYAAIDKEEKWGIWSAQDLLKYLGYDLPCDGQDGPKTQTAIKAYQKKKGMKESGMACNETRKHLYTDYFADCNGAEITAKDFDDVGGNPYAGCSEFNLLEKTQGACEKNRRVGVFQLKSNKNFPINYPCAKGDIAPCKKQTGRKGDRRTPGFGCFFYDQLIQERPNKLPPEPEEPITNLKWDVETAWCGDALKLTAGSNLADGTEVTIQISTEEQKCDEVKAKIQGGKLEYAWKVHTVAFAYDDDKKPKPEVEIFTTVTAAGKKYDTKPNLRVKKLVEAKPEEFSDSHSWGTVTMYNVRGHFFQGIAGEKAKVTLKKKVLKTWGATYVSTKGAKTAKLDGVGGGFPWAGNRWARCPKGSMMPNEYYEEGKWHKIDFEYGGEFGTMAIIKTGEKYHWVHSASNEFPGTFPDYDWNTYQGRRDTWIKDSNKRWTGVHTLKRKGCTAPKDKKCCTYEIDLDFTMEKVEAYVDETICLAPGPLRSNAGLLFYGDDRIPMCAHEVGHLVGQPDEYDGGAVNTAVNGDGAKNGLDGTTLMGGDLKDPNNQIKVRHYSNFAVQMRKLFSSNGGKDEEWSVLPTGAGGK